MPFAIPARKQTVNAQGLGAMFSGRPESGYFRGKDSWLSLLARELSYVRFRSHCKVYNRTFHNSLRIFNPDQDGRFSTAASMMPFHLRHQVHSSRTAALPTVPWVTAYRAVIPSSRLSAAYILGPGHETRNASSTTRLQP